MANTYRTYTGNGSTTTYAIPVSDWISDSHIIVQLDADGTRYDSTTAGTYSFDIDGTNIEFDVAPASGIKFIVMRDTLGKDYDDTALDYDFTDGSVVTGDQLDGSYRHGLYLAQEAADLAFRKASLTDNSVLAFDSTSDQWEALPLDLNYDSTTGFFGIGGAHDAGYKYKFHGDILVEDGTGEATLTVQHTGGGGSDAATLRLIADNPTLVWNDDAAAADESFIHLGYSAGVLALASYTDVPALKNIIMTWGTDGEISMFNLPTTDPLTAGQLWTDNNQVKVSTGSAVSRHLYDSGWVSSWGANTLGPNERGVVVMSTTVDGYFPFQVNVWWRSSSGSTVFEQLDSQPKLENGATLSSGLEVFYDSSTRELYIDTQDVALYGEVNGGGSTSNAAWTSGTNQIRVTIT